MLWHRHVFGQDESDRGQLTMLKTRLIAVVTAAALLSGCNSVDASKQDQGLVAGAVAGGIVGSAASRGRPGGTILGALVGGIVGSQVGRSMDRQDRILAQQAEILALERGDSGRPTPWRNPENGRYGEVVPMQPYERIGYGRCRDFTHTVYIDGRPEVMRSTACRNPDGSWRNVG